MKHGPLASFTCARLLHSRAKPMSYNNQVRPPCAGTSETHKRQHQQLDLSLGKNPSTALEQELTPIPRGPRTAKSVMELDLDDLLGRVNLIDRRIAREEREQKARDRRF